MDGIPALDLWHVEIEVLYSSNTSIMQWEITVEKKKLDDQVSGKSSTQWNSKHQSPHQIEKDQ